MSYKIFHHHPSLHIQAFFYLKRISNSKLDHYHYKLLSILNPQIPMDFLILLILQVCLKHSIHMLPINYKHVLLLFHINLNLHIHHHHPYKYHKSLDSFFFLHLTYFPISLFNFC